MKALITVSILLLLVACAPPVTESGETTSVTTAPSSVSSGALPSSSVSISDKAEASGATSEITNDNASEFSLECQCGDGEDMLKEGNFIDATIIKIIGDENFNEWLENTPEQSQTVYKLVEDFDLSWEELQNVVHASTYAKYIEHMPNGSGMKG